MSLSGQQCKELQKALIDAFPNTASLEQMLAFELDKNLRAIAGEGSLQDIVFKLIQTANSQGWVEDLVRAAFNSNSGNPQLRAIAQKLLNQHEIRQLSNIPVTGFQASEVGADYTILRDLLSAKKFEEADKETFSKVLWLARRENEDWLQEKDILNLPCRDLHTIDQLWLASSDGKFGFSVQKQIWIDVSGRSVGSGHNMWKDVTRLFFKKVGWIAEIEDEIEVCYDLRATRGHLPEKCVIGEVSHFQSHLIKGFIYKQVVEREIWTQYTKYPDADGFQRKIKTFYHRIEECCKGHS